jgi:alkanesulfonate monooxygenase SsuD/methylene tetrahydromethanopterin reductase-like flavin-dependent oxidoreductase (luciferase family)
MAKRLGFFTRLLDETTAAERYRLATAQIVQAERCGFDSAWIAQHHFHEPEGGLPAPFVFLAHAAAATQRIRLGTGIVTLPLEFGLRVAEDAVVLDLLSNHRLEVGVGPGGNLTAFHRLRPRQQRPPSLDERQSRADAHRLGGRRTAGRRPALSVKSHAGRSHLAGDLLGRGLAPRRRRGDGLMLSRTQPRERGRAVRRPRRHAEPDARCLFRGATAGQAPRILASRTIFVVDDRKVPIASPRPACRAWSTSARRWVARAEGLLCTT